jgi:hypothetical protein
MEEASHLIWLDEIVYEIIYLNSVYKNMMTIKLSIIDIHVKVIVNLTS